MFLLLSLCLAEMRDAHALCPGSNTESTVSCCISAGHFAYASAGKQRATLAAGMQTYKQYLFLLFEPGQVCRKGDAGRLVRKLLVMGVLEEDTFRQDNEYNNVSSRMRLCPRQAAALRWAALPQRPGCHSTAMHLSRAEQRLQTPAQASKIFDHASCPGFRSTC